MPLNDGYGTVADRTSRALHDVSDAVDEERAALLGKPAGTDTISNRLHKHMTSNVSKSWGDLVLLGCYIITGLLDSSSVSNWGSFVSMQTGNTIYVGLGVVAPHESTKWIRSGISILCFCLGSVFFSIYHRRFSPRRRWVMVSSCVLQLLMIIAAALMVTLGPATGTQGPVTVWIAVPIALIAFQSAGQAVISRALQYNALTSVVLTSIYLDLFSDQKFFAGLAENVERNRRAAAPLLLLVGAVLGGLWAHSEIGLAGALWTAVALKVVAIMAWLLWPSDPAESA